MVTPIKAIRRKKQFSVRGRKKPRPLIKRPIRTGIKKRKVIVIFIGGSAQGGAMQNVLNSLLAERGLAGKFEVRTRSLVEPEQGVAPKYRYLAKIKALKEADAILIDPILHEKLNEIFPGAVKLLSEKRFFEVEEFNDAQFKKYFNDILAELSKK